MDSGTNRRPALDDQDPQFLYFISSNRHEHTQPQAYRLDLKTKNLRRLTYQNGEVFEVIPMSNNQLIYSSSTDEIKEDPDYIRGALAEFKGEKDQTLTVTDDLGQTLPRTEIYKASLDGNQIERITDNPGFDGDISLRGKRYELAYVRWVGGIPHSHVINIKTKNKSDVGPSNLWTSDPAYSPRQDEMGWIEQTKDGQWLLITGTAYGKQGKIRYQSPFRIRDLSFHSDGEQVVFSEAIDAATPPNYEIFLLNIGTGCKRRLTYHSALDLEPQVSQDGSRVYFSSSRTGIMQIFELPLGNLPTCP